MKAENKIAAALARSASHSEIVRVEVAEIAAALAAVNAHCDDYDHTDANEGEDVWGTTEDGSEFRLMLVLAKAKGGEP